ncbi:MAG: hypothetical protein CMN60_23145 [Sphingobium sp.]|nr:hypothetical protein [Sphingobium sp.]MBS50530.1 hypothetical protein [Sphingobium sp.]|tara:strand:- start:9811 stop:10182 length:372 start_codon:yes stop_codon:yes gene_type:complete
MTQDELTKKFPFLTGLKIGDDEYLGIIENVASKAVTFYDFEALTDHDEKVLFLKLGSNWWWETNRSIPIGVYLFEEMKAFSHTVRTYREKDVEVLFGPYVSLDEMCQKKFGKKRVVKLVTNMG